MDLPEAGRVSLIVPGVGAYPVTVQPLKLILGFDVDTRPEDFVHRSPIETGGAQLGFGSVPSVFQSREMRLEMSESDPAESADALKRNPIWEIVIHGSKLSISG